MEKVIEEVIKRKIVKHFEDNDIILEEHHGGRRAHSTISAKTVLENAAHESIDSNKFGVLVSTDLTAAFDLCDHSILKEKLKYYGLEGNLMKLMESYLSERYQYVELQTRKSKLTKCLDCSVIQGSIWSGLLYMIYTNEIVRVHHLIHDKEWLEQNTKLKHENYNPIDHTVVNFMDDSNSLISFTEHTDANHYLNRYFDILKIFYNSNKLCLNPEKTNVLILAKPKLKKEADEIKIVTEDEDVTAKNQIKVLGFYFNERMSMDTTLDKVVAGINSSLAAISNFKPYMSERARLTFVNSYLASTQIWSNVLCG